MIIESMLDTDLYKLTMMQGVLHQFPWACGTYEFKCRNQDVDLTPLLNEINQEIDHLCTLSFQSAELDYLRGLRFIKEDFIQFLRLFRLNRKFVQTDCQDGELVLKITGPWLHTILFEVPLLAIVNELYFKKLYPQPNYQEAKSRLQQKIKLVKNFDQPADFIFSDFGTRRRFSRVWHEYLIPKLKEELPQSFKGTSNVLLAMRHNLYPIGTMAHEWLMASQALGPRLALSQKFALEHWAQEYRGDLGIALSDVFGFKNFLKDFDMYFAKLFDGCRHDSGDPFVWGDALIKHYQSLRIDPLTKMAVFSDGLTFPKALQINDYFRNRIRTSFGIGTNLTNDVSGTALQIVIKMTSCQEVPVAKLSDSPGKQMCRDASYLEYIHKVFKMEGN